MQKRTQEQIRHHYIVEKALAERLKHAPASERKKLYAHVYDELFSQVPDHPQLTEQSDATSLRRAHQKWKLIQRFVGRKSVFLEIGAGDCILARLVAGHSAKVFAIEVSAEIIKNTRLPANAKLILSDGTSVPVPTKSVDVAFSNQVLEHLHPDDAREQLKNIYACLKPRGKFICITPNRFSGPHDISQYFDRVAKGLHLKEYTIVEIKKLFKNAGFRSVRIYWGGKGIYLRVPGILAVTAEFFLEMLPYPIAHFFSRLYPIRALLGIVAVAVK